MTPTGIGEEETMKRTITIAMILTGIAAGAGCNSERASGQEPTAEVAAPREAPMKPAMAPAAEMPRYQLADNNLLTRPEGYRSWMYVGAPVTPNDMNDGKAAFPEFHSVYIDPDSYRHWSETGEFRDGTILIKELISVGGKKASSGNGYFMGEFVGLEAAIKSKSHFPDEPGNWAYYSFTDEEGGPAHPTASPMPTATCNGCHGTTAEEDYVFTQYYPVLRAAAR
jgi:hypothetical protein